MKYDWQLVTDHSEDIIGALLKARNIGVKDRDVFLHPDWDRDTHDPFIFTKMQPAIDKLFASLEEGEKIVIHGDYDADGVSGSALLITAIRDVVDGMNRSDTGSEKAKWSAKNVDVYLPDREKDGYGVAMHTIERLAEEGVKLLITVDCGIANIDEFIRAHELGIDVIICDHHQLAETVPEHALIIHPL
ncbi:MAG: DHH family phosphoesterase, partial [bacterium]|nr:DHH family phosphoesterase [bacterium]